MTTFIVFIYNKNCKSSHFYLVHFFHKYFERVMDMQLYTEVKQNMYYDSVSLMALSSMLSSVNQVKSASVMMGTDQNKQIMRDSNLNNDEIENASTNDLMIGLYYKEDSQLKEAMKIIDNFFNNKKIKQSNDSKYVKTFESALKKNTESNLAVISVPGKYAKKETMKALDNNLHVLLFSDNVLVKEETELKEKAIEKGLLMMGPDCGTAIINGTALGFANVVKRGNIGMVAAAGTGLQEATVLVDKLGGGISQAIGTGGRDVKDAVGGKMMLQGIEALEQDQNTDVIVLISKPPSKAVMEKIIKKAKESNKKIVTCLLGGDYSLFKDTSILPAHTIEDAASIAVDLSQGKKIKTVFFTKKEEDIYSIIESEVSQLNEKQQYVRGLYSGGTLCFEGMLILRETVEEVYSNVPLREDLLIDNIEVSQKHTFIDMGEDYFTDGVPHPMIDSQLRKERIIEEAKDKEVAVILLDIVLGYGSHEDPAGAILPAIEEAKNIAKTDGRHISFIASVCGTEEDPQSLEKQEKKLKEAGVVIMSSNAQAARIAAFIASKDKELRAILWRENR